MGNFLNISYWFHMRPNALGESVLFKYAFFIATLFILSIIFQILKRKKSGLYYKIWQRLATFSVTNAFIGIVLLFFSFEEIPILSARFWLLIWVISMVFWLFFIIKNISKIPKIKERLLKEEEYKKYIP